MAKIVHVDGAACAYVWTRTHAHALMLNENHSPEQRLAENVYWPARWDAKCLASRKNGAKESLQITKIRRSKVLPVWKCA